MVISLYWFYSFKKEPECTCREQTSTSSE